MIYLIGGGNLYLSSKRLEELKSEFIKQYDGEIQVLNADEINDYNEILSDTESISLFSQEKLFIIKRLFSSKTTVLDKFSEYLKSSKIHIIFWEDKAFDKRRSLYKLVKKIGVVEEFGKLKYSQLKSWISKYLNGKCNYSQEVIESLILKVGDDQMQLASILDNLLDLISTEGRECLDINDINKFVEKTAEESIWDFVDALSSQDRTKALEIIEGLLKESQDFVMVVGMIARQFRIMASVKYCLDNGKNYAEITKKLKLHPFVVRKAISFSDNFSLLQLRKLFNKLVKTDLAVKQGRFDEKLALDLLIAAL